MNNHFKLFGDRKGNIGRIKRIYKRNYKWYVSFARNILRDEEKAIAIVIAAFETACQQHEDFQSKDDICSFLYATIDQNCIATRAKMLLEMHPEIREEIEREIREDEKIKKFVFENVDYIITKEVREAIQEEIEKLPSLQKQIVRLFFCGEKTKKIAEYVGRDKQTVRNNRRAACIALFIALQKKELLFSPNLSPCNLPGFMSRPEA